ncbi:hypothetical protein BU26DRAFT_304079 [Trematosphaeria pertusa]|uniref:HD/PDEase domain-containing protein n=1 Tax=Trematosphaeria pertusa TaxID=390896 RepID=A0A6A6IDM8_9PLEO|nr:uncharacterized protein BU26DRAFT_304079 [Trematosphaeria pertusa]KAF2248684.1 hypothetical protein BU26DRAFT_304079 [Trematosphaeria pertusa]
MCPPEAFASSDLATIPPSLEPESFIPPTDISQSAYDLASSLLAPAILSHSIRTYLYAQTLAASSNSIYHADPAKRDLLFVACILHDIGTTETYNGPQRFEVEGGDAAVEHLSRFGVVEEDKKDVWTAIALHTCNGIVQRMGELPALVRKAIEIDFGRRSEVEGVEDLAELKERFERRFARQQIEKVLGDAVVAQAIKNPDKAPAASWPGGMYRAHLTDPDWKGVNKAF